MPKHRSSLGEIPKVDKGLGKAGAFQADHRITSTEAGRHVIPEHDQAIEAAMKPLYGGLAGSRCDPVEEWPGDHDEAYGMPKAVRGGVDASKTYGEADRDDQARIVADKAGKPNRRVANSDLSGVEPDDDSFNTHH